MSDSNSDAWRTAHEIVTDPSKLDALAQQDGAGVYAFGTAYTFSETEHGALGAVRELVRGYLAQASPKRPLNLAVFGPPGSGKSFLVKQIKEQLAQDYDLPALGLTELNLTQVSSTRTLARALQKAVHAARELISADATPRVPLVFFDEFDTTLDGTPLGWLSWMLSPMQDGEHRYDGQAVGLRRAIFVFAGGTAATLEEFAAQTGPSFRAAKGPDFLSRLSGYLDLRGPNDSENLPLRRGLAVRVALQNAAKVAGRELRLAQALTTELLKVGRYRHGMRSVEKIVEMTAMRTDATELELAHLPPQHLLDMHTDRGPLDPRICGGLIGLSVGGALSADVNNPVLQVADVVWELGGTIAYGGSFEEGGITQALQDHLNGQPERLARDTAQASYPRLELYDRGARHHLEPSNRVRVVQVARDESKLAGEAVTLSRMRWQSGRRCCARILIGGKSAGYSGRMPGLLEEAVVALALGQPLFVLGAEGGTASLVGALLGMSAERGRHAVGRPRHDFSEAEPLFALPGMASLPHTPEDAERYIAARSIGGPGWIDNGLSVEENRELFAAPLKADSSDRGALDLLRIGLQRLFSR